MQKIQTACFRNLEKHSRGKDERFVLPLKPVRRFSTACAILLAMGGISGQAFAAECPIKLGGIVPLSAPGSVTGGEAQRDAMLIAVEEINARGGVLNCKVELVVADTEGLPEKGTAVMEKLISNDGVVGVAGGYHSSVGMTAKEVAHDKGVPVIFASTWNDQITAAKLPEAFRLAPLSSEASAIYWKFAASIPNVKKSVIVTENTDYGIPAAEETEKGLESAGIDTEIFAVDLGTQDFSGIIQRVKAEKPDVIITLLTGEASLNFEQQAAETGIGPGDLPFVCDIIAAESETFWKNVPDGNYCFFGQFGLPESLYNDQAQSFAKKYKARTGKTAVESYAIEAYDAIVLLTAAIAKAGDTKGSAIVAALENIQHDGALGKISFPYGSKTPPASAGKEDKWWHQYPDPAMMIIQYQKQGQKSQDAPIVYPATYKTGNPVFK